jgi:hypothetical protein
MLERLTSPRKEVPTDLPRPLPEGSVRCFEVMIGDRALLMLVTAGQKPRAYFDLNGDRRFSDEEPVAGRDAEGGRLYGPVAAPAPADGERNPARFYAYARVGSSGADQVRVFPATYQAGTVRLKGSAYRTALIDADCDGRLGTVCKSFTGNYAQVRCDCLAFDFDGNGQFDPVREVCPLSEMIRVQGICYSVSVSSDSPADARQVRGDGTKLTLEPVNPQFKLGQLATGCTDAHLLLYSAKLGLLPLGGGQGEWVLPDGAYTLVAAQLARTDEHGGNWVLKAKGSIQRQYTVDAGERSDEEFGTPLTVKADVSVSNQVAYIECSIFGQGGEEYEIAAERNGKKLDPPKVKIIDERGRTLDSGSFTYG